MKDGFKLAADVHLPEDLNVDDEDLNVDDKVWNMWYLQLKRKYQGPLNVCDIINTGSFDSGSATCYLSSIWQS